MRQYAVLILLFFLSVNIHSQTTNEYPGIIQLISNPCETDPCLPGLVWSLKSDTTDFLLSINNNWIWSDEDLIINGKQYFENDSLIITGIDTIRYDLNDDPYYKLEIVGVVSIIDKIEYLTTIIFPNPCKDLLHIDSRSSFSKLRLYSITGQLLYERTNIKDSQAKIDMDWLDNGIYLLELDFNGRNICNYEIIKK